LPTSYTEKRLGSRAKKMKDAEYVLTNVRGKADSAKKSRLRERTYGQEDQGEKTTRKVGKFKAA